MAENPLSFLLKLAGRDHHQTPQPTTMPHHPGSAKLERESSSHRTKKLAGGGKGGTNRKKQPQRGMGVEQLERLRLQQEHRNTPTATNQFLPPNTIRPVPPDPPVDGVPVPVHYGAWNGGGAAVINGVIGVLGWDESGQLILKRAAADNGGTAAYCYNGFNGVNGSGQVLVNPYATIGAPHMRGVQVGTPPAPVPAAASVFETSRELSSMPKTTQHHHQSPSACNVYIKKKRFYGDNERYNEKRDVYVEIGYKGRRENYAEISPINAKGYHFLGLNPQKKINKTQQKNIRSNGEMGGFSGRDARSAFHTGNYNFNEGVEVVAIHRKGTSAGGSVFMEYEFFPGKNGKSTPFKEIGFPSEASVAAADEASWATTSDYSGYRASNASNSVDLSLKLSC
ncbi:hypothetical protein Tsubulata_005393 [Turnera subulata]|uniref:Uncharacterized protein n=1 Tax=Turnera subulata TaxID=218843 RepID=A0A9Q0G4D0_9ROSI|nr:hypothetical protein Tsubulata_005393 [Turnera subulata]